jgi:hypothetical protein
MIISGEVFRMNIQILSSFHVLVQSLQFWSINMIQDDRIKSINTLCDDIIRSTYIIHDDRIWQHMSFYRQHNQVIKYRTI